MRGELERVDELLEASELSALPSHIPLPNVVVALVDREIVGAIALVVHARFGFVCAAVVDPAHRGSGVGGQLMQSLLSRANELGLCDLYLLTRSAQGFFERHEFVEVDHASVPGEIRNAREYRDQSSDNAHAMRLPLDRRS